MHWRAFQTADHSLVTEWNRQLQIDEGASAMPLEAIATRLSGWLSGDYEAVIFELGSEPGQEPIGYALYRPTDADQKESGGIYLRQFFIAPGHRRLGHGTEAIGLLLDEVVPGRRLVLEALNTNPNGQQFWRSLGMRVYSVTFEWCPPAAQEQPKLLSED
jgi:ribosomal protein S18 acetylase RimI-like enzyme